MFLQGQPASRLFIIERGRVSLIDPEHRYREPEPRLEGDAVGGLSFLTGARHTKTAVTTEETAVWELRRRDLDSILPRAPRLAERLHGFLEGGEASDYLTRRLHLPAERAVCWCRAAQRALENRQPMPPPLP